MIIKNTYKYTGFIITLLCALSILVLSGMDSYLEAMPEIASYFGVNISVINLTITFYFLGCVVGSFFGGPL